MSAILAVLTVNEAQNGPLGQAAPPGRPNLIDPTNACNASGPPNAQKHSDEFNVCIAVYRRLSISTYLDVVLSLVRRQISTAMIAQG